MANVDHLARWELRLGRLELAVSPIAERGCSGGPMLLILLACENDAPTKVPETPAEPACEAPTPPADALWFAGDNGGIFLLTDGRLLSPAGTTVEVGGLPEDVLVVGENVVVANPKIETLTVLGLDGAIRSEIALDEAFFGLAAVGSRVFASAGESGQVAVYDLATDGTLSEVAHVAVGGTPAGIEAAPDGSRVWIADFTGDAVVELDVATLTVTRTIGLPSHAWDLAYVAATDELYVTEFRGDYLAIVDVGAGTLAATLDLGDNPHGVAASPDGRTAWVSLSNDDRVVAIDTAARAVVAEVTLTDADLAFEGTPQPGTSPTALVRSPDGTRLFVARAADNAVAVLDADTLTVLGAIPVGWYPTAVALTPDGGTLVVANGKGVGSGPNLEGGDADRNMVGTVSVIPWDEADLPGWSAEVLANLQAPDVRYPFTCEGTFPVPREIGDPTPIEHVILVVRENKTYDCLLGDLETGESDPSQVLYGEDITPNLHALARAFTSHDNFYDLSENSVQGHLWLTSSMVNDYMERFHTQDAFVSEAATEVGRPSFGTFFTHLMRHGVPFVNMGEIVGTTDSYDGELVMTHTDLAYPGVFFNLDETDESRVLYAADKLFDQGTLPAFTFMLLPRDHTAGGDPGEQTPETMINDNDYATGLLIDRLSHSPYWDSTVVFILEDDPQTGADHIDGHRSILLVASPWAKRGHTSSVHAAYPSVFRTMELLLGVPPMNRYDGTATPLWDAFTSVKDSTPYTAIPRTVADATNPEAGVAARWSGCLDLWGPDRNPWLGELLWLMRFGEAPRGSALRELEPGDCEGLRERIDEEEEEEEGEGDAYDAAWAAFEAWQLREGKEPVRRSGRGPKD